MRKIKPEKIKGELSIPDRESYPHFGIDLKHLPEAKNWEIGKNYLVTIGVRMTGISINERRGKEDGHIDFEIREIEAAKTKKDFKLLYRG